MIGSKYKLLFAAMLLGDLVLLLVWGLRDGELPAVPSLALDADRATAASDSRTDDRSTARVAFDATRPTITLSSKRARAPIGSTVGVRVEGTVYGLDDRALISRDILIVARDDAGGFVRTHARPTATYCFTSLHPGKWTIVARCADYRELRQAVELHETEPVRTQNLVLAAADELRVRLVTPDGHSLAEALETAGIKVEIVCVATREEPKSRTSDGRMQALAMQSVRSYRPPASHADAIKGFGSDIEGILYLRDPLPAFVSVVVGDAVLQTKLVEVGRDSVTFVLAAEDVGSAIASLRLVLVDSQTNSPIAKARVTLEQSTSLSDENGAVEFQQVPPGTRRLEVRAPAYETAHRQVEIAPGRVNDLGLWPIDAVVTIRGRFLDAQGRAVRMSWSLTLAEKDPAHPPRFDTRLRNTDGAPSNRPQTAGAFFADDLGRGKYWIRTHDTGKYAPPTLVDASQGPVKDVVIRVFEAVAVSFRFPAGEETYIAARIFDETGAPVTELATKEHGISVHLGPGAYTIRYRIDDGDEKSRSFVVDAAPMEVVCER